MKRLLRSVGELLLGLLIFAALVVTIALTYTAIQELYFALVRHYGR